MPTVIYYAQINYHTELNEFKKSLITWAQNQATGKRVQASLAKTQKAVQSFSDKAESYDFVAKYLEGMEIVETTPTPAPIKICPDNNRACEENCSSVDCHLILSKMGLFDVD